MSIQVQIKTVPLTKNIVKQLREVREATQEQGKIWERMAKFHGYLPWYRDYAKGNYNYLVTIPGETVLMNHQFCTKIFGEEVVNNCRHIILEK